MPENKPKYYVTTPIYYVNARPHIGHAYTTIVADVVARRRRLLGDDVWFLTGTDEHGQKIERAAKAANTSPQEFADSVSIQFRNLWDRMGLTYDQYIRTTDAAHKAGVQKLFSTLKANGFIYLNAYTGAYCVSDEAFVDAPVGTPCPDCGRILEEVTEENYFFKLSAFQEKLIDKINSGEIDVQPEGRRNEVLSFLRGNVQAEGAQVKTSKTGLTYIEGALKDLSISRSSFNWGVPVPGDPKHVIYVWLDALANYITALGYGSADESNFEKYWPADLHLVGKEIIRFHCVYWPAFLMAAELPLPKKIVAHGWLLFEESKMSKSRGNIVRAETILDAFGSLKPDMDRKEQDLFGADVLRYFLLREIPFGQDGSFSFDALVQRYNSDLASGYGNLVSRILTMIQTSCDGAIPDSSYGRMEEFTEGFGRIGGTKEDATEFLHKLNIARGGFGFMAELELIQQFIKRVDQFLSEKRPWKLDDADPGQKIQKADILYCAADAMKNITFLLHRYMPYSTATVWKQLGFTIAIEDTAPVPDMANLRTIQWGDLKPGTKLGALGPIFPRADKELITRMNEMEQNNTPAVEPVAAPAAVVEEAKQFISIDDVMKVDLRVAQIKVAERIPKSDKLLRLEVDLGTETRQILAGIAEHYEPETLIGRKVIIVANLAPRKMRGLESQGMLLAASLGDADKPSIAGFLDHVELGARVK
jgi:methionyl-tRNA synthetase